MQHTLPEGTDRSTRNAAGTFSGHRHGAQSEDLRTVKCCLPSLFLVSSTTSGPPDVLAGVRWGFSPCVFRSWLVLW